MWVDETGSRIDLTPTHARAPRGQRAAGRVPRNRGSATTLIAALTLDGIGAGLTLEGGVSRSAFTAYVEAVLAPSLRPGQIVALDNVGAHRTLRVRHVIEAQGAELWLLPAYSPDLNPIEEAFSKFKARLRRAEARTPDDLAEAIWRSLPAITARDVQGWYRHAGYLPSTQDQLQ